jgi:hypothetical protein
MKKGLLYLLTFMFAVSFTACEKDEAKSPDYVGTWTYTETDEDYGIEVTQVLTLTEKTIEMLMSMKMGGVSIEMGGMKGSMTVTGDKVVISATSLGSPDINEETGEISEVIWYQKGSAEFTEMIEEWGGETMEATYKVSGNTLTITSDDGEGGTNTEIYTKS